jgi:hypothetical protein
MQVYQLLATQDLQCGLHLRLHHFKLAPRAGYPNKALVWQAARAERRQLVAFDDAVALNVEDTH